MFQGILEKGNGIFAVVHREVRHLCCYVVTVARMACQCDASMPLRLSLGVHGCRVEVVQPMCQRIVNLSVDHFLVHFLLTGLSSTLCLSLGGQPHHTIAQYRYLVVGVGIGPIGHFPCRWFLWSLLLYCLLVACGKEGCPCSRPHELKKRPSAYLLFHISVSVR